MRASGDITTKTELLTRQLEAAASANAVLKKENSYIRSDLARQKSAHRRELSLKEAGLKSQIRKLEESKKNEDEQSKLKAMEHKLDGQILKATTLTKQITVG